MTTESKLVPVPLLRDIEMTWREASAFSNTANSLIERRLPELRALLATPMPPQASAQPDPIIGVLKSNLADGVMPSFSGGDLKHLIKLLEAPHAELAALREELAAQKSRMMGPAKQQSETIADLRQRLTAAEQRNADDLRDAERYRKLRKVTPYRFKKMQDASVTDGGDVLYFHSGRFDVLMDAELAKPTESGASE